jgi:hypothetical protein
MSEITVLLLYINILLLYYRHDKETEEKAQRAIDTFFQNNLVAPSPAPGSYVKATPGTGIVNILCQLHCY